MAMSPTALYNDKLQISDVKYRDLKLLCDNGIIPKRYHQDYFNLSHGNVTDSLTLTDEEDERCLLNNIIIIIIIIINNNVSYLPNYTFHLLANYYLVKNRLCSFK